MESFVLTASQEIPPPPQIQEVNGEHITSHPHSLLVTKYMGSKKPILSFVIGEIVRWVRRGDLVVDLLAGTHTIGYALKPLCRIVANDIQKYSLVLGRALLNYSAQAPITEEFLSTFRRYFFHNMRHLNALFAPGLELEQQFLYDRSSRSFSPVRYWQFCQEYPHYLKPHLGEGWEEEFALLFSPERIAAYAALNCLEPYSLFSLYYANAYLGVRQAAEVDSVRYAIDKMCNEWIPHHPHYRYDGELMRSLLLTALIMVLNHINVAPGHWASIPRIKESNWSWVVSQRRLSVIDLFHQKVKHLVEELPKVDSPYAPHMVTAMDYEEFLNRHPEVLRQARVIYVDPPYSQAHYSRFYHILETLVLYDYPPIEHSGRYRKSRFQSAFAKKTRVEKALEKICRAAQESGSILIISYSQGGVIPNDEAFRALLEKFYPSSAIQLKLLPTRHSRLGRSQRLNTHAYLFTCLPS